MRHQATAALAIALSIVSVFATVTCVDAEGRTTYVSWHPGTISVAVAAGAETDISFAPGEQLTYVDIDDGARWDARVIDPILSPDRIPIPRLAVQPNDTTAATLTVFTTGNKYRILVRPNATASQTVAFVYARVLLDRRNVPLAPATPAPLSSPSPVAIATASPAALPSAPAMIVAAATMQRPAPVPEIAAAIPPAPIGADSINPHPNTALADPCASDGGRTASPAVRGAQYAAQAVDAVSIANAVKKTNFTHVIFGVHTLPFYLLELGFEDLVVGRLTKKACANTKNFANGALGASALINTLSIPAPVPAK